jgi:hypothetical protein
MKNFYPYIKDFITIMLVIPYLSAVFFLSIWSLTQSQISNNFLSVVTGALLGVIISSPLNLIGWGIFSLINYKMKKKNFLPYTIPVITLSIAELSISKNEPSMSVIRLITPIFICGLYWIYSTLNNNKIEIKH